MTTQRDADRILRAWLDLMPDEAPDRTVAAVLQAVETTPQARRPLVRAPWRSSSMTRFALVAAVVALGVALLGGALLVVGGRPNTPQPAPVATPATPVPASPTQAAASTSALAFEPAPAAIRGNWIAARPGLGEPTRLVIATNGDGVFAMPPTGTSAPSMRSQPLGPVPDADALLLSLERATPPCAEGALGRYRWRVEDDGLHLVLTADDDPCSAREAAFAGRWTRTHNGLTAGGTGVITGVGPLVQVTLPAGSYSQRTLPDVAEIYDSGQDLLLYAFKNPQAFADPCRLEERRPWAAGARAFIDALRQNPAMTGFKETPLEIGGFPAIHLTLTAKADYPVCTPEDHPFYQWAPRDDAAGSWWLSAGDRDSMYLVDHPDATLLFQVLPIDAAAATQIIDSIRFPETLPSQ